LFLGKLNKDPGLLTKFGQMGKPVNDGRVAKNGRGKSPPELPINILFYACRISAAISEIQKYVSVNY
jgi:hypothetical protein